MTIAAKPQVTETEKELLGAEILAILAKTTRNLTGEELAQMTGAKPDPAGHYDDRRVRMAIERMINQGHLIAANTSTPAGYFLVQHLYEAEAYEHTLKSRALKNLIRLRDFHRNAIARFSGQLQLPLGSIDLAIKDLTE